MWSAGASETVKAAYMQSASQKGALAADQIRQRYYKKEWEQIQSTRIGPLRERLEAAKALRAQTLMSTVMPVKSVKSIAEAGAEYTAAGLDTPPQQTVVPGKKGKDGQVAASTVVEGAPQAAPNQAAQGEIMGAISVEEKLAINDPVSGTPIPIDTPRARSIIENADSAFWGEYSSVTSDMMDTLGEYVGNPYADGMADNLMQQVIKQGNIATTGQTDAGAAEDWMMKRKKWEADQEASSQTLQQGQFNLESNQAGLEVGARDAGSLLGSDEGFRDFLKPSIVAKMDSGTKLTRKELMEASGSAEHWRKLEQLQIKRAADSQVFKVPTEIMDIPQNWQSFMMTNDKAYGVYYGNAFADLANKQIGNLREMEPEDREKILRAFGASEIDVRKADANLWKDPNLTLIVKAITESSGAAQKANDAAYIRRLPEVEANDRSGDTARQIDATLDQFIEQARESGYEVDAERIRAERYVPFFEATNGRDQGRDQWGDPVNMDPHTEQRLTSLFHQRNPTPEPQPFDLSQGPWAQDIMDAGQPAQPSGPLANAAPPGLFDHPKTDKIAQETKRTLAEQADLSREQSLARKNLLSEQPATNQTAKARPTGLETSTTGGVSEWERVYGAGAKRPGEAAADLLEGVVSGVASAGRSLFGYERGQRAPGVVQENGFAYDVEGRPLDEHGKPLEYSNPYINTPVDVLRSLRDALPPESQAMELITDALLALEGS
jgi:hypothetical protein